MGMKPDDDVSFAGDSVDEGGNSLAKCAFCRRKIPKEILRTTKRYNDGRFTKNHNTCADCILKIAKTVTKTRGQKKAIEIWNAQSIIKKMVE